MFSRTMTHILKNEDAKKKKKKKRKQRRNFLKNDVNLPSSGEYCMYKKINYEEFIEKMAEKGRKIDEEGSHR